jgi:maltose O-acetyltransferase
MTEKEKMLSGLEYDANDPELLAEVFAGKDMCQRYNSLPASDATAQRALLKEMLGTCHDDTYINPPFYCDYGKQIHVGKGFFANFHFTVLDEAPVTIGDNAFIGPNVSLYTACHSTIPAERNTRYEWAKPITIGNNCWLGGSVTVLPGVTIGDNCTIGAGSVVSHDIPANSIAVGNPCHVIKTLEK